MAKGRPAVLALHCLGLGVPVQPPEHVDVRLRDHGVVRTVAEVLCENFGLARRIARQLVPAHEEGQDPLGLECVNRAASGGSRVGHSIIRAQACSTSPTSSCSRQASPLGQSSTRVI